MLLRNDFVAEKSGDVIFTVIGGETGTLPGTLVLYQDHGGCKNLEQAQPETTYILSRNVRQKTDPVTVPVVAQSVYVLALVTSASGYELSAIYPDQDDVMQVLYSSEYRNAGAEPQMVILDADNACTIGIDDLPTWHQDCQRLYRQVMVYMCGSLVPRSGGHRPQKWKGILFDAIHGEGVKTARLESDLSCVYSHSSGRVRMALAGGVVKFSRPGMITMEIGVEALARLAIVPMIPVCQGRVCVLVTRDGYFTNEDQIYHPCCSTLVGATGGTVRILNAQTGDYLFIFERNRLVEMQEMLSSDFVFTN